MYGDAAIAQCLRVLKTLTAPGNLPGIRADLRRALGVDWSNDIWIDKSKVHLLRIGSIFPCADALPTQNQATDCLLPFIATCLLIACAAGSSSVQSWLFPLNIYFDDVTNDDGISIYDITEPQHPRYAFMFPGENVLIDALQYHDRYNRSEDGSEDGSEEIYWPTCFDRKAKSSSDVEACLDFRPVTVDALYDVWSRENIKFGSKMEDVSSSAAHDSKLTLKDQSLARLLDAAFESNELNWMASAELLPEFRSALKTKLYDEPGKVLSTSMGLKLLTRAVAGEPEIDLSPFPLSLSQVHEVLQQAWEGTPSNSRVLLMPDMSDLTTAGLESIIQEHTPSTLVLGTTTNISLRDQLRLVQNTSVTDFVSHALYKRSHEMISSFADKLPNLSPAEFVNEGSQPQISQVVVLKYFSAMMGAAPRLANGGVSWSRLTPQNKVWVYSDDTQLATLILPFRDAPISPSRIPALLPMIKPFSEMNMSDGGQFSVGHFIMNVVKTYASAGDMIRPLPAELMAEYHRFSRVSLEHPPKTLELGPSQWTLLVACEGVDSNGNARTGSDSRYVSERLVDHQLRYAFVRRNEAGRVCVENASGFLRSTLPGAENCAAETETAWQEAAGQLGEGSPKCVLTSCDVEEVQEALSYLAARDMRIDGHIEACNEPLAAWNSRRAAGLG